MERRQKLLSLEEAFNNFFKLNNIPAGFNFGWSLAEEAMAVINSWHTCVRCNEHLSSHAADGSCYTDGPEKYVEL